MANAARIIEPKAATKKVRTPKKVIKKTPQDRVLLFLSKHEPFTQYAPTIAKKFKWEPTIVRLLLVKMEADGFVKSMKRKMVEGRGAPARVYKLMAKGKKAAEKL